MTTGWVEAPAKINLRLRVLAREAGGYHQIETLFGCLRLADELRFDEGLPGLRLRVEGADLGPVADNLVARAAAAFLERTGVSPALDVTLRKRIPAGAGLGGGSSDAATTLRALNRLYGEPCDADTLLGLAADLGSDVPFFLSGAPYAIAWGRGDRCLRLAPPPDRPVLLGVPSAPVSTAEAYAALDIGTRSADVRGGLPAADEFRTWSAVERIAVNDFEPTVLARIPVARAVLQAFAEAGAIVARLSGSGSSVFGVFEEEADLGRAAELAAARAPDAKLIRTATAFGRDESGDVLAGAGLGVE